MRIVAISDTHNRHEAIAVEPCDLLLHAGDVTARGTLAELAAFLAWFERQPIRA
jgi:predicted phosphodiesterase